MFFTASGTILTGIDKEAYSKALDNSVQKLMREGARRFVQEAVRTIPIRTGFVRGAFRDLEEAVGAGGANIKSSGLAKKYGDYSRKLSNQQARLREVKANLEFFKETPFKPPPLKETSTADIKKANEEKLQKLVTKLGKQVRSGKITNEDRVAAIKEAKNKLNKESALRAANERLKNKKAAQAHEKLVSDLQRSHNKLIERLESQERFLTKRVSKLEERVANLKQRVSKFLPSNGGISPLELRQAARNSQRSPDSPQKFRSKEAFRQHSSSIRNAIKNQQRAPLQAGVEFYTHSDGSKTLKTPTSGTAFASKDYFQFDRNSGKYEFKFNIDIIYFNINDIGANRFTPSSPWNSFYNGRQAFTRFLRSSDINKVTPNLLLYLTGTRFVLSSSGLRFNQGLTTRLREL